MSITTTEIRKLNCSMVYKMIYESDGVSKDMISRELNFSLPTISQNLNTLLAANKIYRGSVQTATGGRPAVLYKFNANAKIAIGVEVLAERLNVAAVNLRGEILRNDTLEISFLTDEAYFSLFGGWINRFINSLERDPQDILGIAVTIQGIVAADGEHILYGKILNSNAFSRSDFARCFSCPLTLIHDAEAAAIAEHWHDPSLENAIYLSLNPHLGSAVILHDGVLHTPQLSSGTVEHMTLHPNGNLCYCGKRGCADAYCSANSLLRSAAENFPAFFQNVRIGNIKAVRIWHNYLQELALLIDNLRMVTGSDIIIGGLLAKYFSPEDLQYVKNSVLSYTTFRTVDFQIHKGHHGEKAALVGAALTFICDYLKKEALIS
ncbi:MAG: ROK family protein [Marvinbryantia sp.]|uniref:ROK family protein n=1 Tax=Marvinbryantia sp. TaxID=2496532 RepID=UPI00399AD370